MKEVITNSYEVLLNLFKGWIKLIFKQNTAFTKPISIKNFYNGKVILTTSNPDDIQDRRFYGFRYIDHNNDYAINIENCTNVLIEYAYINRGDKDDNGNGSKVVPTDLMKHPCCIRTKNVKSLRINNIKARY